MCGDRNQNSVGGAALLERRFAGTLCRAHGGPKAHAGKKPRPAIGNRLSLNVFGCCVAGCLAGQSESTFAQWGILCLPAFMNPKPLFRVPSYFRFDKMR